MITKTFGAAISGVDAQIIRMEISIEPGVNFMLVGLPDSAVRESHYRIETALEQIGYRIPVRKIIINMAPADLRKEGSAYDLPLAVGILEASEQVGFTRSPSQYMIMGELSLDGRLQAVRGALPMALEAARQGFKGFILPMENAEEAAMVKGLNVYGCHDLQEVIRFLSGETDLAPRPYTVEEARASAAPDEKDFAEVKGQQTAKRALEIAAAGGHNVLLIGPPGSGKTMLASRMPGILPTLSVEEAIETTKIHSVAGQLGAHASLLRQRPFRAPHHTISHTAMVGGGSYPLPGEISLAHNGVLFLDELPEFQRATIEVLRQPLEDRKIALARAKLRVEYPAGFTLVCAMNPCPCGYYNHPTRACTCKPDHIHKYLSKISGPLLDRIDLQVQVSPVPYADLTRREGDGCCGHAREEASRKGTHAEASHHGSCADHSPAGANPVASRPDTSAQIRLRVASALARQQARFSGTALHTNAQMQTRQIERFCRIDAAGEALLKNAVQTYQLSARAYHRILKVARTIADLAAEDHILAPHLAEAIHYRCLDKGTWGER